MKKLNKKILIGAIGFIIVMNSCSKSNGTVDPTVEYSKTLFTESTGWKRVATFKPTNVLLTAVNWMVPFDFNIVDSKVQLVFSQNNNFNSQLVFKGNVLLGSTADASVNRLDKLFFLGLGYSGVSFGDVFFKPGTYNIENLIYPYGVTGGVSILTLHNEAGGLVSSQLTNFSNAGFAGIAKLSNGDFIGGDNYGSELVNYNRSTNIWFRQTYALDDKSTNVDYIPFKIADGTLLAFRYSFKTNPLKGFLSVGDFVNTTPAKIVNRFVEEHPEYAPTSIVFHQYYADDIIFGSKVSIVNYAVDNNSFTVVLKEENNTTHNYTLSAYKWTSGTVSFQKLYSSVPISKLLGDNLNRRDLIICQPDGTVATIVKEGTNGNELTYSLATCDAKGEHKYGAVVNNTYPRAVTLLSCLRYINGSYYAVASPSLYNDVNADGQHIDVVKLSQ